MSAPSYLTDLAYTDEYRQNQLRVALMGDIGSGKTTFASTFPSPLIIDFDKGLKVLEDQHIKLIPFAEQKNAYRKVMALLKDAMDKTGPFSPGEQFADTKTLVIDGITAMSRVFKNQIMAEQGKNPTSVKEKADYDTWGALGSQLYEVVHKTQFLDMSIVITALPRVDQNDLTGELFATFNTEGRFREHLGGLVDEVYYMEPKVRQSKKSMYLYTAPYKHYPGKTRIKKPKPLPYRIENPTYDKLYVDGIEEET